MGDRSEHWVGYPTLTYPLPYGVKMEGRCEVRGGGGRSEHWVGYPTGCTTINLPY